MEHQQPDQRKEQLGQFKCEHCGQSFNSKEQLRQHEANCMERESEKGR